MSDRSRDAISTFESAARWYADIVATTPVAALDGPGLGEWDLRSLIGHTARSLTTVTTYLARPAAEIDVPSAAGYYQWTVQQIGADPAAVAERGRQAGMALGDDPAAAVDILLTDAISAVSNAVGDPIIETIAGGMRLSNYLPTRTFELVVHTLDIATALGRNVTAPPQALTEMLLLAIELTMLQGDGQALLLALTGRKPLQANFSVL